MDDIDKYIIASTREAALNAASVWQSHPVMRASLERRMFEEEHPARKALAATIQRAEAEGVCEPGHECGRCENWPPKLWHVQVSVTRL